MEDEARSGWLCNLLCPCAVIDMQRFDSAFGCLEQGSALCTEVCKSLPTTKQQRPLYGGAKSRNDANLMPCVCLS